MGFAESILIPVGYPEYFMIAKANRARGCILHIITGNGHLTSTYSVECHNLGAIPPTPILCKRRGQRASSYIGTNFRTTF
jgi:hypothetical protein